LKKKIFALLFVILFFKVTASAVMSGNPQSKEQINDYFNEELLRPDEEITIKITEFSTYRFTVKESGFYLLEAVYFPLSGISGIIGLEFILDCGTAYTAELHRYRLGGEILTGARGSELPPLSRDYDKRLTRLLKNGSSPLYIWLRAGMRAVTINGLDNNVIFESFTFKNYENPPYYADIRPGEAEIFSTPPLETGNQIGTKTIFMQAEKPSFMTGADVRITSDAVSYNVIPVSSSLRLYNTLGGNGRWSKAGQAVSWEFRVANDGYYRFSVKARQNVNKGESSFRRVLINNTVPVREFAAPEFKHNNGDWYRRDFTDANGEDIYIFLNAGRHVLTLEAVTDSPLELDYIEIATVHEEFARVEYNLYHQLLFSFNRLIRSYLQNPVSRAPVDIWVDADYDTMLVLREFVSREYSGQAVSINMKDGSVLEAALAGNPPCAALFVSVQEIARLEKRGFIAEYCAVSSAVLLRNNHDFYAEQEAREFWVWFTSAEIQADFMQVLEAAKGVRQP